VLDTHKEYLIQRLKGLADPSMVEFYEQEMIFSLKTGNTPDVTVVRLRRKYKQDRASNTSAAWHFRYIGTPENDQKCPTIVRKTIDSLVDSNHMMDFVKALGLRIEYEFFAHGIMFTKGRLKISVAKLKRSEQLGIYDNLKDFSNSHMVEISISLPEGEEYMSAAKAVRDFADQLKPICDMLKLEYWR